jgi:hypothetical protein
MIRPAQAKGPSTSQPIPPGGAVGGSGTAGTLPIWTAATLLGDSLITQAGVTVTIGANLTVANGTHVITITTGVAGVLKIRDSVSATDYLSISTVIASENMVFGNVLNPMFTFVGMGVATFGGNVVTQRSAPGSNVSFTAQNDSNTASSNATTTHVVAGASAGDSFTGYQIIGGTNWAVGSKNSDGDAFVISENATPGTNNRLRIAVGGAVLIPGALTGSSTAEFSGSITSLSSGAGVSSALQLVAAAPAIRFSATGQGPDDKEWDFVVSGTHLLGRTRTDILGTGQTWLVVYRTGVGVPTVIIGPNAEIATGEIFHVTGGSIFQDNYGGSPAFRQRRANGTFAAKTAVAAGDTIGNWQGQGYETVTPGYFGTTEISFRAVEAFTNLVRGTRIVFSLIQPLTTTQLQCAILTFAGLHVGTLGPTASLYRLDAANSSSGTIETSAIRNTNVGANSAARFYSEVLAGGSGANDAYNVWAVGTAGRSYALGLDVSASALVASFATAGNAVLGTGNLWSLTENAMNMAVRHAFNKGIAVASASDVTLGVDGNLFHITGTTTINRIATANWQAGAIIILHFDSTPVVAHQGVATGGGFARLNLRFSVNFTATANSRTMFYYDGTDFWQITPIVRP